MSAFLGPIHHWLFNKIRLFEALEQETIKKLSEKYGEDILNIHQSAEEKYGSLIPQQDLESLIDTDNIHGWLQHKIKVAEIRQAATYREILQKHGDAIVPILLESYQKQGSACGRMVKNELGETTAIELYKQLNNYLLDGMPCDHVNNVTSSTPERLEWITTQCLHKPYWKEAGMDEDIMYSLRFEWVRSFVEAANPAFTYKPQRSQGQDRIQHTISVK